MLFAAATKPALLLMLLGGLGAAGWVTHEALTSSSGSNGSNGPTAPATPALGGGSIKKNGDGASQGHRVDVTGTITGAVTPGGSSSLAVTITNPNSQAILVNTVSGTITEVASGDLAGLPICNKDWYRLGTFTGSLRIERGANATVQLPLVLANLPDTNQDNCKGATFTYTFSAAAQQA